MKLLVALTFTLAGCTQAGTVAPTASSPTPVATIATLTPTASPAPTASPIAKLHIGESVDLSGVRITLQTAAESAARQYSPTAKPGMSFVSTVFRYDNGLAGPIQIYWEPWQMVGTDGVRRTPSIFTVRDDTIVAGSIVPSGGFLVGSLTFEAPSGPLDLYYTNPTTGRQVIWTIR